MKKIILAAMLLTAFALAKPAHVMKITQSDGSVVKLRVHYVSEITFKADVKDSTLLNEKSSSSKATSKSSSSTLSSSSKKSDAISTLAESSSFDMKFMASEKLIVLSVAKSNSQFVLYDMNGHELFSIKGLAAGTTFVNLREYNLIKGRYVAVLRQGSSLSTKQIVIAK